MIHDVVKPTPSNSATRFTFTSNAAVDLEECTKSDLNENKYVFSVFVDLFKAFEVVDWGIVCDKMERMEFRIVAAALIKSYLTIRAYYTRVNGADIDRNIFANGCTTCFKISLKFYLNYLLSIIFCYEIKSYLTTNINVDVQAAHADIHTAANCTMHAPP